MGWFGALSVGYRWPFRRMSGAGVDQRFLGKQAETDWTPEITSFKGAGQQKRP